MTFAEETGKTGKTRMTLHTRASAVAEKAIVYLQGVETGWTMSIDKLEKLLARSC